MKTKSSDSKIKVLLLITGSIAAVRIPLLVSQLAKENYEIRCVLSKNADKSTPDEPSVLYFGVITFLLVFLINILTIKSNLAD